MSLLALDSRWRRFNAPPFEGIFDIGFSEPEDWPHAPFGGGEDLIIKEDRLNHDLCRLAGRYFLRVVAFLPVRGTEDQFGFGLWAEVSEALFRAHLAVLSGEEVAVPTGDALIANALPGFEDTLNSLCQITPDPKGNCPSLQALTGPLANAQTNGISFDDLLDIYAASGNDIRPQLMQD